MHLLRVSLILPTPDLGSGSTVCIGVGREVSIPALVSGTGGEEGLGGEPRLGRGVETLEGSGLGKEMRRTVGRAGRTWFLEVLKSTQWTSWPLSQGQGISGARGRW